MDIDPQAVKTGFDLIKGAIDTLKGLRDLIPSKSGQSDDVTKQIELAERQIALGEAQLAQALGYQLCRKHFPPKPMLADRFDPASAEQIYKCADCGQEHPSPEHYAKRARDNSAFELAKQRRRDKFGF